jgi:hypothetical protein
MKRIFLSFLGLLCIVLLLVGLGQRSRVDADEAIDYIRTEIDDIEDRLSKADTNYDRTGAVETLGLAFTHNSIGWASRYTDDWGGWIANDWLYSREFFTNHRGILNLWLQFTVAQGYLRTDEYDYIQNGMRDWRSEVSLLRENMEELVHRYVGRAQALDSRQALQIQRTDAAALPQSEERDALLAQLDSQIAEADERGRELFESIETLRSEALSGRYRRLLVFDRSDHPPDPDFLIEEFQVDFTGYQERRQSELQPYVDSRDEKQNEIEALTTELESLHANDTEQTALIREKADRIDEIHSRMGVLQREIQQAAYQFQGALPPEVVATKTSMENNIHDLEDYILGQRTREDGTSIPEPIWNPSTWHVRLDNMRGELKILHDRIISRFDNSQAVRTLEQELKDLIEERSTLTAEIAAVHAERRDIRLRLEHTQITREVAAYDLRDRERTLKEHENELGAISFVVALAEGKAVFEASREPDPSVLELSDIWINEMDDQISTALEALEQEEEALIEAESVRDALDEEMELSLLNVNMHSDHVRVTMLRQAVGRAGIHMLVDLINIGLAYKDGGIAGVLIELGAVLAEYALAEDHILFESFDESELRTAVLDYAGEITDIDETENITEEYPLGDEVGSSAWSSGKTILECGIKRTGLHLLQGKVPKSDIPMINVYNVENLSEALDEMQTRQDVLRGAADEIAPDSRFAARAGIIDQANENLVRWSRIAQQAQNEYAMAENLGRRTGTASPNMTNLRRNMERLKTLSRQALQDHIHIKNLVHMNTNRPRQTTSILDRVKDRIRRLRTFSFRDLGRDAAVEVALEAAKEAIYTWLDSREEDAWLEYFKAQICFRIATYVFKHAGNHYWSVYARVQHAQKNLDTLRFVRDNMYRGKLRYQNGISDIEYPFGLTVRLREEFPSDSGPVYVVINTLGRIGAWPSLRRGNDSVQSNPRSSGPVDSGGELRFTIPAAQMTEAFKGARPLTLLIALR